MAWISRITDVGSQMLTEAEAENNVIEVWNVLGSGSADGVKWSENAVAAACGNMWYESHINPGQWELGQMNNFSRGFGLGQWTPASKLVNWADASGLDYTLGDTQLKMLATESGQWHSSSRPSAPSPNPPITWDEFKVSKLPVDTLTFYYLVYWEDPPESQITPGSQSYNERIAHGRIYYELITGRPPEPPGPTPTTRGTHNFFLRYCKRVF